MSQLTAERTTLSLIAERFFDGLPPERIIAETGLSPRLVLRRVERLRAVAALVKFKFPRDRIAEAARLRPGEAKEYLAVVEEHLHPRRESATQACSEEAAQALEVLDFWASKWL